MGRGDKGTLEGSRRSVREKKQAGWTRQTIQEQEGVRFSYVCVIFCIYPATSGPNGPRQLPPFLFPFFHFPGPLLPAPSVLSPASAEYNRHGGVPPRTSVPYKKIMNVGIGSTCARRLSVSPHFCSFVSSSSNIVMSLYPLLHSSISYSPSPHSGNRVLQFCIPPLLCRDSSFPMHPSRIQIPPHLAKKFQYESHTRSSPHACTHGCKSQPAQQYSVFP